MKSVSGVSVFDGNDSLYQKWLIAHPDGYVLNSRRSITPSYLVLHRANCTFIKQHSSDARDGAFTERGYIKICSDDLSSLRAWAKVHGRTDGSFSSESCNCRLLK